MINNKKGSIGSGLVWVVAFLTILFIMFLHIMFTLFIFAKTDITVNVPVTFEGSNVDLVSNLKFLNFLGTKILVGGKNQKIIDVLRNTGDPYSHIKNNKGQSLTEVFGLKRLTDEIQNPTTELKEILFYKYGFTEDDYDKFFDTTKKIQDNEFVDKIIIELNKICKVDKFDKYYLDTPYGMITKDGMKQKGDYIHLFDESESGESRYIPHIDHKTNYRGENIEIKLIMLKECQ